jgi:hypothetical protein
VTKCGGVLSVETIIVSLIVMSIILFGALTISQSYLSSQDAILASWREMEERTGERARTDLSPVLAETSEGGDIVEVTLRNEGDTKLADFDRWDVIVQYYTTGGDYIIKWLPYTEEVEPADDQWTVAGIYSDASKGIGEVFEPGILNPGEEIVIRMRVLPVVAKVTTNLATIATPNGISVSIAFTR